MSSLLFAELAATCNALGYFDGNKYYADVHCLETIKDLIRYLRRDDENHEIRRHLGETKVLQTDLIPILKNYWEEKELFDVVLRLLVNLTNPALLLYEAELPADKTTRNFYLQIISYLQSYKEAFTDESIWGILSKKLGTILEVEWQERDEDAALTIERILTLIRNVLQVPADTQAEKRPDNDASIHDQVLWGLHQSGMVDLILYLASSKSEKSYYMHVLEVVTLMLREQNPSTLADAAVQRSVAEKERDEAELLVARRAEEERKRRAVRKYTGSRHSRFGGTYVVKDLKSISDQDIIYHKPLADVDSLKFDVEKKKLKTPKNRLPMKNSSVERRSAFSIRLFLKEFCIEFLNGAYNHLMFHVKSTMSRSKSQENFESYYLWAMKFFMEFNRRYKFQVKLVSETMSIQAFHYVHTQLETCYESMMMDKKKLQLWSRRAHLALRAYLELLHTLAAMQRVREKAVERSAHVIMSNLFYVLEYRELVLTLFSSYSEVKLSRAYLKDLVETTHIFLKLLEKHCETNRSVVVQTVAKKQRKKKSKGPAEPAPTQRSPEDLWDELGPQVSALLQSGVDIPQDIAPFDATSDRDVDDQRVDAMRKIQGLLKEQKFEEAVGMLRSAREVWPENDCFGAMHMAADEELLAVRDIFMADIPGVVIEAVPAVESADSGEDEVDEEDEDPLAAGSFSEKDFKFLEFVKRFATIKVLQACGLLLRQFETNSVFTNHCVAKLLHRLVWDCGLPAILFQATIFRTFQRVLASEDKRHRELATLATFIVQRFAAVASTNSKVFMELLFWKTSRDATQVQHGYETAQSSAKGAWAEEEEEELLRLHAEYLAHPQPEVDAAEWIQRNLIRPDRTIQAIRRKLKQLGCVLPSKASSKKVWSEEQVNELRRLYESLHETPVDIVTAIRTQLSVRRPRLQIAAKLFELGLIEDIDSVLKARNKRRTGHALDAEEENIPTGEKNIPTSSGSCPQNRKKRVPRARIACNPTQAVPAVREAMDAALHEALQWLAESLQDAAEDWDMEGEPIPLVPISEDAVAAMDEPLFLKVLEAVGLTPPADEQEAYWRIPVYFTETELCAQAQVIVQALAGNIPTEEHEPATVDEGLTPSTASQKRGRQVSSSASESEDEFSRLTKFTSQPSAVTSNKKSSRKKWLKLSGNVQEDTMSAREDGAIYRQRTINRILGDDSDMETTPLTSVETETVAKSQASSRHRIMQVEDGSDTDRDALNDVIAMDHDFSTEDGSKHTDVETILGVGNSLVKGKSGRMRIVDSDED